MAKLAKMPNQVIIDGFKGKIDFYVNMGIPCARRWPRSPGRRRAPAVEEQWAPFVWASQNWNSLTPEVQDAYKRMAAGTNLSGRDIFMKCYLASTIVHLD